MPSLLFALRRNLCSFNAIALALLAFQNAGYIVLMGYAQQLQEAPPVAGQPHKERFFPTHFLATTEFVKLVLCMVWCMVDVLTEMQKRKQDAADEECILVEAEELIAEANGAFDTGSHPEKRAVAHHDGVDAAEGMRNPVSSTNPVAAFPASPSKPVVYDDYLRCRLFAHPTFSAQFVSRMRHAVGLDGNYKEALLMVVPAVLYTIQGLLLILALQHLDPTVFQILYQVRILFLAMMMRVVLDFRVSPVRWAVLMALTVGIILAQLSMQRLDKEEETEQTHRSWSIEGTLAALAGALLSSFTGVFTEYVYKKRGNHFALSARSIHLAFFSLVYFSFVFARDIWTADEKSDMSSGLGGFFATFFDGFTGLVWFLVVLQAMGGILVALVVRYCDNIVKSFSTAFAIVLSGTASVFLFNLPLEPMFLLGSFLVISSITVYSVKR
ncbi:putative CMP-sialic acid transporter [Leptomonas pyrrhocoris]|uniref:Putative CMP-sialic acid transporter n=1 Tax=Leptomonas pyrrhocoris TaxID=157538 RepID=A0A0M9FZD6_LEPPY|nr:putative CMP-sialic acid transporter [Leptomonas pyrrhocoris]XP_015657478.1 putative CMP-sialic acid transporter [Leptomonas pyrrhocoris]KPA79038.1 putative CMP-sialic acid transporter [Leptomonas pyrrhocoris]KPA79039.1 putative CMP-sialic acid transporter [Leptomonas pyrrhocoris]|eukprot:XP_015657477.1 putative CMP-sialic acid transporter [Leptomonas pyrrhocoris]